MKSRWGERSIPGTLKLPTVSESKRSIRSCLYCLSQVITRNKQCSMEPVTMCTDAVTILYRSHEVFMEALPTGGVGVKVDGGIVDTFPHRDTWLALEQPDSSQVTFSFCFTLSLQLT